MQAITAQAASFTESGLSADAAAKVIAEAVTARKPRPRYTIGRESALITCWRASCPTGCSTASLPPLCIPTFLRRRGDFAPLRRVNVGACCLRLRRFYISLRSRCTPMLAGARALIQTRRGRDR